MMTKLIILIISIYVDVNLATVRLLSKLLSFIKLLLLYVKLSNLMYTVVPPHVFNYKSVITPKKQLLSNKTHNIVKTQIRHLSSYQANLHKLESLQDRKSSLTQLLASYVNPAPSLINQINLNLAKLSSEISTLITLLNPNSREALILKYQPKLDLIKSGEVFMTHTEFLLFSALGILFTEPSNLNDGDIMLEEGPLVFKCFNPSPFLPLISPSRRFSSSAVLFKKSNQWGKPSVPNSLTNDVLKSLISVPATTVMTTSTNPSLKAVNSHKVIAYKDLQAELNKNAKSTTFANDMFVVWDLETITYENKEVPVMLGYVIAKGEKTSSYTAYSYDLKDPKREANMITAMLEDIIRYVEANNLSIMEGKEKKVYLYAHNSSNFDSKIIMKSLYEIHIANNKTSDNSVYEMPEIIRDPDNKIFQTSIVYKGIKFYFRDSILLLTSSVDGLNDNMLKGKYPKLPMNLDLLDTTIINSPRLMTEANKLLLADFVKFDPRKGNITGWEKILDSSSCSTPHEYLSYYCVTDCLIVAKSLQAFAQQFEATMNLKLPMSKAITISSLAMYVYKLKFAGKGGEYIMSVPLNSSVSKFVKESYMGGRTEVFDSGIKRDTIYHFDVPGMYAKAMTIDLPIGNPVYIGDFNEGCDYHNFIKDLHKSNLIGFFKCIVESPKDIMYPVLPVKHEGKLVFPKGNFLGRWVSKELELAISQGYKVVIKEGYVFKAGKPLSPYRETFTNLKQMAEKYGDKTIRTISKLFNNSLYGKIASSYFTNSSSVVDNETLDKVEDIFHINSVTHVSDDINIVSHSSKPKDDAKGDQDTISLAYHQHSITMQDKDLNIAVASTITSYGRIFLYEIYLDIIKAGGFILYSDTDSVYAWLPTSPFGMKIGRFIWDGNPESNTFSKSLFIAPKMYYTQDLNGKITFKVKGVNTNKSNIKYEYDDLVKALWDGAKISFDNQIQFHSVSKNLGVGIIVKEGLVKRYLLKMNKREWVRDGDHLTTKPLALFKTIETKTADISLDSDLTLINNMMQQTDVVLKATDNIDLPDGCKQIPNSHNNSIQFIIPIDKVEGSLETIWSQILHTARLNSDNITKLQNISRLSTYLHDPNPSAAKKWVTLFYCKGYKWMGYRMTTLKNEIISKIVECEEQYNSVADFKEVVFTVYFNTVPRLAEHSSNVVLNNISNLAATYIKSPQVIELEQKAKRVIAMIEKAKAIQPQMSEYMSYLKNIELDTIDKYRKALAKYWFENFDWKSVPTVLFKVSGPDMPNWLFEVVWEALWNCLKFEFNFSYHHLATYIYSVLSPKQHNELAALWSIKLAFTVVVYGINSGNLKVFRQGKGIKDPITGEWTTRGKTYSVNNHNWPHLYSMCNDVNTLSSISITPHIVEYNPESKDPMLSSRDKVDQINKLNSVKVYLRNTYIKYLQSILLKLTDRDTIIRHETALKLNIKTPNQLNSFLNELNTITNKLQSIGNLYKVFKTNHYYNIHFIDERGRIYTKASIFSHMASKLFRPTFCLENSEVRTIIPKQVNQISNFKNKYALCSYYYSLAREFNINVDTTNLTQMREQLIRIRDNNFLINPRLEARISELSHMIETERELPWTMPDQLDMKNNAIQHIATIVGDKEAMKSTGVIPGGTRDVYTNVTRKYYDIVKQHSHMKWAEDILAVLPNDDEQAIKILRAICKKPAIVMGYSASYSTMSKYIKEEFQNLFDNKIPFNSIKISASIIIETTYNLLSKTKDLIKFIQRVATNLDSKIEWGFKDLTDFKVRMEYLEYEIKDVHLSVKGEKLHTTYKVYKNIKDSNAIKNSTLVNIIHSLDALHLQIIVNECKGNWNAFTIHDAILCNPQDVASILKTASSTFMKIHKDNSTFKNILSSLQRNVRRKMSPPLLLLRQWELDEVGNIIG